MTSIRRSVCRVDALSVGDQIFTTARCWETVTGLDRGERFSRSTRVFTDRGGDYPWVLVNQHRIPVRRVGLAVTGSVQSLSPRSVASRTAALPAAA